MGTALDVAIGLVFMYLLLALLVSTLQELLAGLFSLRAKQLYNAIEGMLTDGRGKANQAEASSLVQQLYTNPLVANLAQTEFRAASAKLLSMGDGLPSYIPSKTFAVALLGVLKGTPASQATGADKAVLSARAVVDRIEVKKVRESLALFLDDIEHAEADGDKQLQLLSQHIEQWFNDRMARVSGWYKRKSQWISLLLALLVSVACNANSIRVASELWSNATLRAAVVASAQAYDKKAATDLVSSMLPLGWHQWPCCCALPLMLVGWLTTALAVSLGATFWFDALGKLLNLRGSGGRVSEADGKVES